MSDDSGSPGPYRGRTNDVVNHIIAISIWSSLGTLLGLILKLGTRAILEMIATVAVAYIVFVFSSRLARKRERARLCVEQAMENDRLRLEFQKERTLLEESHTKELARIRQEIEDERKRQAEESRRELERLLAEADSRLEGLKRQYQAVIMKGNHELHWFAHIARDLAVKMMAGTDPMSRIRRGPIVPAEYQPMLQEMVQHMANTFQLFVPANVFGAIRELHGQGYDTILRAGKVDYQARQSTTQPMRKHSKPIEALRARFQKGDCVLLTGSGEPDWQPLPNDARSEDLSVLLGAAFSKRWHAATGKFTPIRLEWVICIAADQKGAFNESHKPLMKCFNDIFGLLMNIFLRQYRGGQSEPDRSYGASPSDDPQPGK